MTRKYLEVGERVTIKTLKKISKGVSLHNLPITNYDIFSFAFSRFELISETFVFLPLPKSQVWVYVDIRVSRKIPQLFCFSKDVFFYGFLTD